MEIHIETVDTKKQLKEFVWFGINLYKDCAFAAPPLFFDDFSVLDKNSNPSARMMETKYFIARQNNKIVGRIAAIINPIANKHFNKSHARFGWFECINEVTVAKALFESAESWARSKGMTHIQGPLGFTDFDQEGMVVEGFDQLATLVGKYNYPYLPELVEQCGYVKDTDWNEFQIALPEKLPENYYRSAAIVQEKFKVKPVTEKRKRVLVKQYGYKLFGLLNTCYRELYNFSALSDEQIAFYIKTYFSFFQTELLSIVVDEQDEVVALGITMPSLSLALQKAKGRLFPTGWWHLLKALRKNDKVDMYLIAVHPNYQNKGLTSIVFTELFDVFRKRGFKVAETNAELEDNNKVMSLWNEFNPVRHKKRRCYIKPL
jgi:GNAT superfamily N-acetyltransferase